MNPKFERLAAVPPLTPEQSAAAAELQSLGFEQVDAAAVQAGKDQLLVLFFRHIKARRLSRH